MRSFAGILVVLAVAVGVCRADIATNAQGEVCSPNAPKQQEGFFKGVYDPPDPMPADRAGVLAEMAAIPPATAEVRPRNGKPALFVDGRHWPINMYKGAADYRLFGEAGGDLVLSFNNGSRLYASVKWDKACWDPKAGRFDFTAIEDNLIRIHHANPRARVILCVEVSPDRAFLEAHPDELFVNDKGELGSVHLHAFKGFNKGPLGPDPVDYYAYSYTGAAYRKYVVKGLVALVDFLKKSPAGNIVIGFSFSGGMDGQFVQWEYRPEHGHFDYSEGNRRALCNYLQAVYGTDKALQEAWGDDAVTLDSARNPTPEEFRSRPYFDDKPGFGRRLADCRRFVAVGTARTLNGFAKAIQRTWGRPAICEVWWTTAIWSQPSRLAIDELLRDDAVNMIATVSYYAPHRSVGGMGASANNTVAAINRRNVLYVQELDHRTRRTQHVNSKTMQSAAIPKTADEFDVQITRDAASVIAVGGQGFYLFDMFGSWYHAKEEMSSIRRMFAANAFAQEHVGAFEPPSVAFVMDEPTRLLAETTAYKLPNALWRTSGVTPAMHLLSDVDAAFPDYRLVFLWNAVSLGKEQAARLRVLSEKGAQLVVVGRTGICSRDFDDEAAALAALGPKVRRIENSDEITDVLLNRMARDAGARVYSDPGNVTYVGNGVACVHRIAGEPTIDFGEEVVLVDPLTGKKSAPVRGWKPVVADRGVALTCYLPVRPARRECSPRALGDHFPSIRTQSGQ